MNTKTVETKTPISEIDLAQLGGGHFAYIREIGADRAASMLGQPVELPADQKLFCLYQADGTPISISGTREAAVANAFEHDLMTMSVH